jgi:ABC-type transporter Mla subunit MlaD
MSKRAPSTTQLLVIAGFALSCFGILLFLWITFGGPTPFKAKSYEVRIPFDEAAQLAQQSDVRISGVNVGKVQSIERNPGKLAIATIDVDDQYAPLPRDTRALLRTKTLLAETYVELTTGNRNGPKLNDGETLPAANVAQSVQIDEIFRTFNAQTSAAFQSWMQEAAVAINGQGQSLSYAIGEFEPTFSDLDKLFRVLDSQRLAVAQLFRNGATTFQALRGRQGELAGLIQSSNAVFQTTARRNRDIEALFRAFPTFQDESRLTLNRLKAFAVNADPLMRQLVPAAKQLSPTLVAFANLAPEAKGFFDGLSTVIGEAPTGFPAVRRLFRDDFPPLLRAVDPFLRNLNPLLTGLNLYKRETTAFFANLAATFSGELTTENAKGEKLNYLRTMGPINPETLSTYPSRLSTNRNSAYSPPQWAKGLAAGLPSFNASQCSAGITATLDPDTPNSPAFREHTRRGKTKAVEELLKKGETAKANELAAQSETAEAQELFDRLKQYAFGGQSGTIGAPAPPCTQQEPLNPIYGAGPATSYQHTFEQTGK